MKATETRSDFRPNTVKLGLQRTGLEIRTFNRDLSSLFFTLLFPVVMMALFSTVFSDGIGGGPGGEGSVSAANYYLPAMLALGTALSGFQNLSGYVALERFNGSIKRLAGTPLPPVSYFLGKTGQTLYLIVVQAVLILLAARFLFDVELPTDPDRWWTFVWVLLLSTAAWSAAGIAYASLARSAQGANVMAVVPVLLLSFISGVYFPFNQIPEWLQNVANLFPLRWTASAMRSVFLPAGWESVEPGGTWNLAATAIALGVWLVAGLLIAKLTFRWPPQK